MSGTLDRVDWNAELVQGDLGKPFSSSSGSLAEACSWEACPSRWRWRIWD